MSLPMVPSSVLPFFLRPGQRAAPIQQLRHGPGAVRLGPGRTSPTDEVCSRRGGLQKLHGPVDLWDLISIAWIIGPWTNFSGFRFSIQTGRT